MSCANGTACSSGHCNVRNNSPRAPLFPPTASPFGGAGVCRQNELPKRRLAGTGCGGWECLADSVRAADSVQVCPFGPTCGGRRLSGLRRTVVSKEEISRCFGGNTEACSHMQTGRPSPNAQGPATCLQTVAPTGISSRNSLPALNAMPVVQAEQAVQRVLRKRDCAFVGRLQGQK